MPTPSDMAREQMASMGLNAPSILSSRNETRTKEEIDADRQTLVEQLPGVGEVVIAKDIVDDVSSGDYASAGLSVAALGVGFLPAGDILNKPIRAAAKKFRKQDAGVANKMLKDIDSIDTWKKQNPNPKPQKQNLDVEKAANDLLDGNITGKQYRSVVKGNMPIVKIEKVPEVPSFTEIVGALDKDKSAKGILGLNKTVKDGTRVASRLDIPAYERFNKWIVSVHDAFDKKGRESLNGDIMGYGKTAILKNVEFKGMSQGAANIAAKKNAKGTIARIFGDYYNAEPENVAEYAAQAIKDKNWTQVGYNPFRHGFFYDKSTGMPIKSAEEVIQVGPLVLAKNAQKIKISEAKQVSPKGGIKIRTGKPIEGLQNLKETKTVFNEGGVVPMKEQMEMFEDGGLLQEGGTVDPVSGNDVPPGSTQEEVRDDIPAQLSEGEFVFPADVVRYIGLGNLMKIRQDAKMGLKMMDDMGQMGNSDEATMPDDLPFDLNDLDMEDDGVVEFAEGGLAGADTNTGVFYTPAAAEQPIGVTQPVQPLQAASSQYIAPQQYVTPTVEQVTPEFEQFIAPAEGSAPELRKYINTETGEEVSITFINGQPVTPIPAGYVPASEYVAPETAKTERVTTPTTRTVEEGEGENGASPATAFGGFANSLDSDAYSKMTAELGMYQGLSLNPKAALGSELAGKTTPKDVSTAMYQAKVAAIADLGIAKVDGNTIDYTNDDGTTKEASKEDLDFIAEVAGLAKNMVTGGVPAKEAAANALARAKENKQMREAFAENKVADASGDGAGGTMDTSFDTSGEDETGVSEGSFSYGSPDDYESDLD